MHVVAASKNAFVRHWAEIRKLAATRRLEVRVGAAAGAALPTVDVARYGLAGATIEAVDGVLNGTSNYILSKMGDSGSTFEEALRDAQAVGAAEADPRLDVEGIDTACKLVIIANAALAADLRLDDVEMTGITGSIPPSWNGRPRGDARFGCSVPSGATVEAGGPVSSRRRCSRVIHSPRSADSRRGSPTAPT